MRSHSDSGKGRSDLLAIRAKCLLLQPREGARKSGQVGEASSLRLCASTLALPERR